MLTLIHTHNLGGYSPRTPKGSKVSREHWGGHCPVRAASSTGRCNTIQCTDSTLHPRKYYLFGCTQSKPSHSSVPAGLALASDIGLCFQSQAGSSLVLRRPIEITALTGHLKF